MAEADCPDKGELRRFLLGEVSDRDIESLGVHIDECEQCQGHAERISATLDLLPPEDDHDLGEDTKERSLLLAELAQLLKPTPGRDTLGLIDRFVVHDLIARGGMGIVLRGRDPDLKRDVAIKVLAPHLAIHEEARNRFLREAQAAAAIDHEHVMPIFAVVPHASLPYFVMPYNRGGSLQEYLRKQELLPFEEIVRMSEAISSGLAAAHAQGLIHRDIKPANILLEGGSEKVRLTDFGVAWAAEGPDLTRTGQLAGTPAYMAPEQIDGEDVDQRADLFGLGVVFYTMATGVNPFEAATTTATIKRVAMDRPQSLVEQRQDVPKAFQALVAQMLEKLPEDRPDSALEVVERLQGLSLIESSEVSRKKRGVLFACLGALALVVLVWAIGGRPISLEARRLASLADVQMAAERYADERSVEGLAFLTRALRSDPLNGEATQRLVHELVYRSLPNGRAPLKPVILETTGQLHPLGLHFSGSSDRLLAYGINGMNHIWLTEEFKLEKKPFKWPAGALPVSESESGIWCFYWGGNRSYWFIDPDTFGFFAPPLGTTDDHAYGKLSPDASRLLTGSLDGRVSFWDVKSRQRLHEWKLHSSEVTGLELSRDGTRGISVSADGTGVLLDLESGEPIGVPFLHEGPIRSLAISEERQLIATGSADNSARLWRLSNGEPVGEPLRHAVGCPERGVILKFIQEGKRMVTAGSDDHTARIWDTESGDPSAVLNHPDFVGVIDVDASETRIATGCADGKVRLFDLDSLRPISPDLSLSDAVSHVAFANDGVRMAVATVEGDVYAFDLARTTLRLNEPFLNLAEAVVGRRLGEDSALEVFESSAAELKNLAGKVTSPEFAEASRLARWIVAQETEEERSPLSPSLSETSKVP